MKVTVTFVAIAAGSLVLGAMIDAPMGLKSGHNATSFNNTKPILNPVPQKSYNTVCQDDAKKNGIKNPQNWVWSDEKEYCVPNALVSSGPKLTGRSDEGIEATQACSEGMAKCLQNCGQFKPTNYRDGEAGAWVGCRASCSFRCSAPRGGCWKGYCWAGCNTGFPLVEGAEWCYTTKTYSQSYSYVKCISDSECNMHWKCGGPCAAF